jgi:glycine hydroxymethyltransferase
MTEDFNQYQQQIIKNAQRLCGALQKKGYRIVSGGTDNHLFMVDLTNKGLSGKEAQESLEASGIMINKNLIPFDTKSPNVTSGIRVGTPAVTTRGMKEAEMDLIADLIDAVLQKPTDEALQTTTREKVKELCKRFPFYSSIYDL